MTYREAINLGEKVLNMADVADAKIDAWLLLEMVCKIDRSFYYLHMEDEVAEEQLSEYEIALRKRAEHVPLQYIVGEGQFQCADSETGYGDSGGRSIKSRKTGNEST